MNRSALLMAIFGTLCLFVSASPLQAKREADAVDYLAKYGYIVNKDPKSGQLRTKDELVAGIRIFQRYAGLKETGVVDADTLALMETDRCGVADFSKSDSARRKRRYTLRGGNWKKKGLTYKIKTYTNKLRRDQQRATFQKAFRLWEAASQLSFRETNDDNADILIDFKRGYHNDGYPFDGQGGTLAHAFYPDSNTGISGDAHFDDEEPWTLKSRNGVDLEWVAIHEFGHSLGLGHSRTQGSIMYPWYQGYKENIKLTDDDLRGIRAIYGKRGAPVTQRPTEPPRTEAPVTRPKPTRNPYLPDACTTSFDTFFMDASQRTYAFKDQYYWVIARNAGLESGPHKIDSRWRELRQPVDAAFTRRDGRTVFFTGSHYYEYDNNRLQSGPKHIRDYGLPDALSNMDAAFIWGGNGRTYFFKGDLYWRYDDRIGKIDLGYPKKINGPWKGLPTNLDGAMKWRNGRSYFFKNNKYYRINDYSIQVEPSYPKYTGLGWMKCTKNEIKMASENETKGTKSSAHAVVPSLVTLTVTLLALIRL